MNPEGVAVAKIIINGINARGFFAHGLNSRLPSVGTKCAPNLGRNVQAGGNPVHRSPGRNFALGENIKTSPLGFLE